MESLRVLPVVGGDAVDLDIIPGATLAQHLFLAGAFQGVPLCSGAGRCGLCRVRILNDAVETGARGGASAVVAGEAAILGEELLARGWRLACRRTPSAGELVIAPLKRGRARSADAPPGAWPSAADLPDDSFPQASLPPRSGDPSDWLGIDLGTTSIHWRARVGGRSFGGSFLNPQLGAGAEVMSRLALARHPLGAARLRQCVAWAVRRILSGLPAVPADICLAGNSCMTYLALGLDTTGLAFAPYRLDWSGGGLARLDDCLPEVYIPPLIAPFVGGDVSAGLAALTLGRQREGVFVWPEPDDPSLEDAGDAVRPPDAAWLLADLGTNGEFALVLPDGETFTASVPMGPALEGVGMSRGMMAGPGAAVAFQAGPGGLAAVPWAEDGRASGDLKGICGAGYLSLMALLKRLGALTPQGRFPDRPASPLASRLLAGLSESGGEPLLDLGGGLSLAASDVEAMLTVKAAFQTAVQALLEAAGLGFSSLGRVFLAGTLGLHVKGEDLETLGFIPPGGSARLLAVGNASLVGACLAAARRSVRPWLNGLRKRTKPVEVVSVPDFQRRYLAAMSFDHAR